jgi:hypothetical protein
MKKTVFITLAAMLAGGTAFAQDSALLDILVRKKVLTAQEAEDVRAEMVKEEAATTAGKIKLNDSITEMKLGGDLRLRYQYDNKDAQAPKSGNDKSYANDTQRSRWRFRLRLNADFKLGPNWFAGVQLSTNNAADSGNQTYQDGFSNYDIFISKAFLGWQPSDWFTFVAGKQANPLYTTDLVWDADINPTGFSQQVLFHKLYAGGPGGDGYAKDGKSLAAPAIREERPWELTLNVAELIYDDNAESSFDADAGTDAYIFAAQLVGSYKFANGVKATVAPGVLFFNAADLSGFNNENAFSDVKGVSGESRKMTVITAPGDISWKWGTLPVKFYWDFAWNTQGRGRFDDIYGLYSTKVKHVDSNGTVEYWSLHSPEDDFAWLAGMQFGQNKKAGDWSAKADWRQTGISSVDPNLNDSDFALGELNTRGVRVAVAYNFTDAFSLGASYNYAWNLRDDLVSPLGDANVVEVFQVDANLKF